jgi:hypothetical protein
VPPAINKSASQNARPRAFPEERIALPAGMTATAGPAQAEVDRVTAKAARAGHPKGAEATTRIVVAARHNIRKPAPKKACV